MRIRALFIREVSEEHCQLRLGPNKARRISDNALITEAICTPVNKTRISVIKVKELKKKQKKLRLSPNKARQIFDNALITEAICTPVNRTRIPVIKIGYYQCFSEMFAPEGGCHR